MQPKPLRPIAAYLVVLICSVLNFAASWLNTDLRLDVLCLCSVGIILGIVCIVLELMRGRRARAQV